MHILRVIVCTTLLGYNFLTLDAGNCQACPVKKVTPDKPYTQYLAPTKAGEQNRALLLISLKRISPEISERAIFNPFDWNKYDEDQRRVLFGFAVQRQAKHRDVNAPEVKEFHAFMEGEGKAIFETFPNDQIKRELATELTGKPAQLNKRNEEMSPVD